MTSFTLILCVLRMCETHCLCESDYIGVYTLLLFLFAAFEAANFQIEFFGNPVMRTAE